MKRRPQTRSLTVADALALPILRRALPEVVAGANNLGRNVRWVHVLDVDPLHLLRGSELVLSTGVGPGAHAAGQKRFIRGLSEQSATGLIVELGTSYRRELPAVLIEEARAVQLPLVALHRPVRFVDVTEAIHDALIDREVALLRRGQETADRFSSVVLERRGLSELMHAVGRTLGNPVILENLAAQLVAFDVHESSEELVLEARAGHRVARDRDAMSGRGWMAAEVRLRGGLWGQLVALELGRPLDDDDRVVLQQAAVAVALELLQERDEEQLRARARGAFLVDLMQERLKEVDASSRAAALDFPRRHGRLLPVVLAWRSQAWSRVADNADDAWSTLISPLRVAIGTHRPALLGAHVRCLFVVLSLGESEPTDEALDALATDLRRPLERRGLECSDVTIALGLSELDWTGVGWRLSRLAHAAGAAHVAAPALWHDARRGSVADLLHEIGGTPQLIAFARDQLGPLFGDRDPRARELLRTLEVYFANHGRKAQTARVLHLERQSLYLRLQRIERLLAVDLEDPDTLLGLHLAVRMLRLTQALDRRTDFAGEHTHDASATDRDKLRQ